ncbi:hypothetical protein BH10PSE4_BH10PSE4_17730 [soil metagenome]
MRGVVKKQNLFPVLKRGAQLRAITFYQTRCRNHD